MSFFKALMRGSLIVVLWVPFVFLALPFIVIAMIGGWEGAEQIPERVKALVERAVP